MASHDKAGTATMSAVTSTDTTRASGRLGIGRGAVVAAAICSGRLGAGLLLRAFSLV
jgi:hypothetical protein